MDALPTAEEEISTIIAPRVEYMYTFQVVWIIYRNMLVC